jgi:hypothetical protein
MTGSSQERADTLRREAAWCLEQAKNAPTQARREELIALAASFHNLANTTAAHDFGAVLQGIGNDTGQPAAQRQQQIQPQKDGKE